jgi:uncharacterized membrane protein
MSKVILNVLIAIIAISFFVTTDFSNLGVWDMLLLAALVLWGWTLVDRLINYIRK